jgi:FtsH-binding integral membrane protein
MESETELKRGMAKTLPSGDQRGVFGTSSSGLGVSANSSSYKVSAWGILANPILFWGLIIVQLGAVFALSGLINRINAATATVIYFSYALPLSFHGLPV